MSWFNWGKKEEPKDDTDMPTPVFVPMSLLLRSIVYDAGFSNPEKVVETLGLPPISSEVEEMEIAASERRLDSIEPLAPFLHIAAMMLAKATVTYSTSEMDADLPDEIRQALTDQFQRLALGSSASTIANLVEIGLIHLNGEAVGIGGAPMDIDPKDLFGSGA